MKKLLLLGTVFVASGAFAFGGIGIGPWQRHKNQGVDAIGIHIGLNGKKADIDIVDGNTCDKGIPCGNGCCQADNICHQDTDSGAYQCCDKDLTKCCTTNEGVYTEEDWSMGYPPTKYKACCVGTLYYSSLDDEGNGKGEPRCCQQDGGTLYGPMTLYSNMGYLCCNNGSKIYFIGSFSYGEHYSCCPGTVYKGKGFNGADLCCDSDAELMCQKYDENGDCVDYFCCESGWLPGCASLDSQGNCLGKKCQRCDSGYTAKCTGYDNKGNCTNYTCTSEN